jgi:hypothetical protein
VTAADVQKRIWKTHDRGQIRHLRCLQVAVAFTEAHPDGWEGSPTQLTDALLAAAAPLRLTGYVPLAGAAGFLAHHLEPHGWNVDEFRSAKARKICLRRDRQ